MSDCKRLASNLIEISHARQPSHELVAFKSKIYPISHWMGRILVWLYKYAGKIVPIFKDRQRSLQIAIASSKAQFFKEVQHLENYDKSLNLGLKYALEGKPEGQLFLRAKEELQFFSRFFSPLMKEFRKAREERILDLLVTDSKALERQANSFKTLFHDLHFYQKIFDFEEVTKIPLPLSILRKMSYDQQLTAEEENKVKKWISKVEGSAREKVASFQGPLDNSLVRVRYVHRMLYNLVDFINKNSKMEGKKAEVEVLEARLVNLGYKIFEESDPKHIAYRNALKPGDKIHWGGKELIIGQILVNPEKDPHYPIIFAVENDPRLEIIIYHNEAWSYLQRFQESILHCGIKAKQDLGISKFGRVIVSERLYYLLSQLRWTSMGSEIGQKDFVLAQPIVELLRGLITRPFTPQPLLPEYFAFNYNNEMRATECLVPGIKSYTALENFAYECAMGRDRKFNAAVFSHLITASGLGETKEAKAYFALLEAALSGKDPEKSISLNSTLIDEALLKRRGEFFHAIQNIYENCVEAILEKYQTSSEGALRKAVSEELILYYSKRCPGSIIIPKFSEKVIQYTLMKLQLPLMPEFFEEVANFINQKIQAGEKWLGDKKFFQAGVFNPGQIDQIKMRQI